MDFKPNEVAVEVLLKEYKRLGGDIFGDVFLRTIDLGEEGKKALEANDMMIAMIQGKNIKSEWKMTETENWKRFVNLVATINSLK